MNLKTFAQESRKLLMEGVAKRLLYWGFDEKGAVLSEPNQLPGGYQLRGEVFDDPNVPSLWNALRVAIRKKGIDVIIEEAAYTWFNRMMAIKILAKNGYDEPQLDYVKGMEYTPVLLQRARQGSFAFLESKEQERLKKIIGDYNKDQEAFALLLTGYCHGHNTLKRVFGKVDDYTELLLPDNMLQEGGFLHLLNTTDAISDEDYQKVELIGWLYQFYISERKDEVFKSFKKNKKAEAKDIPAATQIFTPNWIVKYMVENTAGRIWLNGHPNSKLKGEMKYYVENEADRKSEPIIDEVSELTLVDPAAGSGHILVEGFDLLYQMYMEEYYTPEEAVESILKHNLFGLDIDDRAAQLATFAILLKAASRYHDVFAKGWLPHVYAMPEARDFSLQEVNDFLGSKGTTYVEELHDALRLMKQAKNLGSIMKLKLSNATGTFVEERFKELENGNRDFNEEAVYQGIKPYIPVLLLLTKKYAAAVANPPYMGQKSMNDALRVYLFNNYPLTYGDLATVFMDTCFSLIRSRGYYSMINQASWLLKPSYFDLRSSLIEACDEDCSIETLLYLGPGVFEELKGEVVQSVCFSVFKDKSSHSTLFRLNSYNGSISKRDALLQKKTEPYFKSIADFEAFSGKQFGFWLKPELLENFDDNPIRKYGDARQGIKTGDNPKFIRFWHEVSMDNFEAKWFPVEKGGEFRKWYGNADFVLNWENDGYEIKNFRTAEGRLRSRPQNLEFFFTQGITWSTSAGKKPSFRFSSERFVFESSGSKFFVQKGPYSLNQFIAFFNSKVTAYIIEVFAPGIGFSEGSIKALPFLSLPKSKSNLIEFTAQGSIQISSKDWDSREISWDFEKSPLFTTGPSLEENYEEWKHIAKDEFFSLHSNEEELNRIFIDIYGLQDELTPEVPLKDITILQEELDHKELERLEPIFREKGQEAIELPIDREEVISQFISYSIGLFMGRYRLDKPGLNIAHPNPTSEELASYSYNGGQVTIDEDAILPLMGSQCIFSDDAVHQFHGLLDTIWGHDTRTENINFIQECLDKDLEKFLVKDLYKYHCGMYKKKPIYWLFSSKKGAFQVLVYMHRMNAFTAEKIRANYLLEHIKYLRREEDLLSANETNLSTQEARKLDQIRKDIIECEEYDLELKNIADQQIEIDLDDGVTVNYAKFQSVLAKVK